MNHGIVSGMLGVALALTVEASVRENPYHAIVARNPFGLRPIPIPAEPRPEAPPEPPLPVVKITGITTLLGTAVVTLQYEDKETKKVEFPPLLAAGESYKGKLGIERIDTENQTVVIRNGGTLQTLDFINHGVKPSLVAAMAPVAPPAPRPFTPPTSDSRVIIGNAPETKAPMTPEQARAYAEIMRRKQLADEQARMLPAPMGGPVNPTMAPRLP